MKIHMNLQLFAQPANHTGATGMSAEMKTYYEKRLLDQAEPLLVHDQFGDKYPIPANNGKTIEFRKYESLPKATEPLTEGVTPNAQALTVTPMTATVKPYGGWAAITDVLQLTAIDNNITQATKVLASQAGRTLDTVTREVLAGGTNVIYAPAGDTAVTSRANLTTASVLTPDLIDQAATALKAQNADAIGESYVAIVHPYVAYDLRRNPEWIDVHKYAAPENMLSCTMCCRTTGASGPMWTPRRPGSSSETTRRTSSAPCCTRTTTGTTRWTPRAQGLCRSTRWNIWRRAVATKAWTR